MKISIAATNPCHLYPLALHLSAAGALGAYYSGYPAWKLNPPAGLPVRTHSFRTTVVYAALRLPPKLRPSPRSMFLWQDHGFDAWTGGNVERCDFIHAMPGQALRTFEGARHLSVRTVLNHATGPVRDWVRIMTPEYARVGLRLADVCPYDEAYFAREEREYALADFHCAASTIVRDQLIASGVPAGRVLLVPYGADPDVFNAGGRIAPQKFRIVFAGQISLRKSLPTLFAALEKLDPASLELHTCGGIAPESNGELQAAKIPMIHHGSVSQSALARIFRESSLLVLPSLEEGFGLVVPQALNCGLPCIVSDRVGAKDLIRHRQNGSIFPVSDSDALATELLWWQQNWHPVSDIHDWAGPARSLIARSQELLK